MDNTDEVLKALLEQHSELANEIVTHGDCCDYVSDNAGDLSRVQDYLKYLDDKYDYHLLLDDRPDDRNRKERVAALVAEFDEEEQQ